MPYIHPNTSRPAPLFVTIRYCLIKQTLVVILLQHDSDVPFDGCDCVCAHAGTRKRAAAEQLVNPPFK